VFSSKNNEIVVKGPKGTLRCNIHGSMNVDFRNSEITVKRPDDSMKSRSLHGLTRTLIYNMIEGVTNGFTRELEVNGVGYRVQKQKTDLKMNLGYSHPVVVPDTEDVSTSVSGNKIIVSGIDKQKVGQFAAMLRQKRPPEPYKGKGIKYLDEIIKRKEGKSGKGAKK
jgi:large subunit ribosomal protein L6